MTRTRWLAVKLADVGIASIATVPGMAVTLAVFIGVQILVPTVIRPDLLPSTTVTFPVNETTVTQSAAIGTRGGGNEIYITGLPVPRGAWVVSAPPVEDSSGQVVTSYSHLHCFIATPGPPTKAGLDVDKTAACLARYNLHQSVTYQPARYYWPLQWYETGIFLALAGALSCTSFWWIRRRRN